MTFSTTSLPNMEETAPCWLNPPSWWKTCCLLFFIIFASTNALKNTLAWIHETTEVCFCKEQRGRGPQSVWLGGRRIWFHPSATHAHLDCCRQCRLKVTLPVLSVRKPKRLSLSPCSHVWDTQNTHSKLWMMDNHPFNSHVHSQHRVLRLP